MRRTRLWCGGGGAALGALVFSASIFAQATERVSLDSGGLQGNLQCSAPSISSDGRWVAFASHASNLVTGDTNSREDIFVRDRQSGTTELVSVDSAGVQGNGESLQPSISSDGRFVAFESRASNLVTGDTNNNPDIFVRDRQSGTTERLSVGLAGVQGDGPSFGPSISSDGRFVAFQFWGANLVAGDVNGFADVFVRDRLNATTVIVSVDSVGLQGNSVSGEDISLSADGRFVAFASGASNLVAGDTNFSYDIFVRDLQNATTERVNVATGGAQGSPGVSFSPSISADGRFVAFKSFNLLVAGDTNNNPDIFVRDRQSGTTELVSVATGGAQANSFSENPSISADGRHVGFESSASNLVPGDTNGYWDVFVHDRQGGTTERVSVDSSGVQGGNQSCCFLSLSADGRFVAFQSDATNLVPGDTNAVQDIFVRDRSCMLASATFRNAGSNPASYTCSAPVLGASWSGTVDLSTTGHSSAYLFVFAAQTSSILPQGPVLLGSGKLLRFGPLAGPLASFSFVVPNDPALCGRQLTTQALHLGTAHPFATSNAMDLVVGQ